MFRRRLGRFRRPEDNMYWLAPSKIFQRKKGRCANLGSVQLNGGIRYCNYKFHLCCCLLCRLLCDGWMEIKFHEQESAEHMVSSVIQLRTTWQNLLKVRLQGQYTQCFFIYCIRLQSGVFKISLYSPAGGYLCYSKFAHSSTQIAQIFI